MAGLHGMEHSFLGLAGFVVGMSLWFGITMISVPNVIGDGGTSGLWLLLALVLTMVGLLLTWVVLPLTGSLVIRRRDRRAA